MDFSGCPTETLSFSGERGENMIRDGGLWEVLRYNDQEGYLMNAFLGTDQVKEVQRREYDPSQNALNPSYHYAIMQVRQVRGHKIIQMRSKKILKKSIID